MKAKWSERERKLLGQQIKTVKRARQTKNHSRQTDRQTDKQTRKEMKCRRLFNSFEKRDSFYEPLLCIKRLKNELIESHRKKRKKCFVKAREKKETSVLQYGEIKEVVSKKTRSRGSLPFIKLPFLCLKLSCDLVVWQKLFGVSGIYRLYNLRSFPWSSICMYPVMASHWHFQRKPLKRAAAYKCACVCAAGELQVLR